VSGVSIDEEEGVVHIKFIMRAKHISTSKTRRRLAIRATWDKEVKVALKTKGFKSVNSAIKHALK
jgi:hypothetical protein